MIISLEEAERMCNLTTPYIHDRMSFQLYFIGSQVKQKVSMNIKFFSFLKKEIGYDLDIISSVKWPVIGHSGGRALE